MMKRLLPVLAMALILILMSWGEASSDALIPMRRYIIFYDHPWGGDYKNGPTESQSSSTQSSDDYSGDFSFRSWLNSWYYFSLLYQDFSRTEAVTETSATQSGFRNYNSGIIQGGYEK